MNQFLALTVLYLLVMGSSGIRLSAVVELACRRNPTLSMCGTLKHETVKRKEHVPLVAALPTSRTASGVQPEKDTNDEERLYCEKNRLTFDRFCEGSEPSDDIKAQIITFCQSYDRLCISAPKAQKPPTDTPAVQGTPREQERQEALVLKADGTLVDCAAPHCKSDPSCWKTCRCARIDQLARSFCPKEQKTGQEDFKSMCDFWKFECTPSSDGRGAPVVEQQSHLSARDKDRKILLDRINAVFGRRASDLPLFTEIREDKTRAKAFQTKNYPLLPSDSSYGAGNFDTLTDSGGVLHRTRSRSPFTKPGLWEANPDNPHNRDHANKWYYAPQSVGVDWLSGQIAWGGHWAVPGAGVGGTNGFSAVHFPSIGTFLNIADDYD
uniref:VDE domain-containing protein n=1 Tax=Steinernema glaseri TaxID=37863 RepID=A0A1I7YIX5_9BILA